MDFNVNLELEEVISRDEYVSYLDSIIQQCEINPLDVEHVLEFAYKEKHKIDAYEIKGVKLAFYLNKRESFASYYVIN